SSLVCGAWVSSSRERLLSCAAYPVVISTPLAAPAALTVLVPPSSTDARQGASCTAAMLPPVSAQFPVGLPRMFWIFLPRKNAMLRIMISEAFFAAAISAVGGFRSADHGS